MTATTEPRVRSARVEPPDRERGERTTRATGGGPGRGVRGGGDPPDLGALVAGVRGLPGEPLPEGTRRAAEDRTGLDLSATRVHRTAEAAGYAEALGARAFTFDRDIVVGHGADATTLAHEPLHAAQFVRHGAPAVPVGIADPAHAAHAQASGSAPGLAAGLASPGGLVQPQDLMEAITPKKQRPPATTWHGDLYRAVVGSETGAALYSVLPEDAKHAIQAAGAAQAFDEAFFRAVIAGLTKADGDALTKEFTPPTARLAFEAGLYGGVAVGVVKDLYSNLEGLYEIVRLGVEYSPLGMTARTLADIAKLGYDPQLFAEEKQAEAAHAQAVIDTVIAFARHIATDPTYLVGKGEEMGAACGEHASEWFHGDFLRQPPLQKGYTVGQGLGMVATEVALLFLGPEEWIAKGAIAVGQAAKATRFGKLVIELLSTFPEVARLLRLRTEVSGASEALKATRTLREAGEKGTATVAEGEKGLAAAGDVPLPKTGEPHAPAPKAGEPKLAETKAAEPKSAEPKAAGPAALEPRAPEPRAAKPKAAKPEAAKPKAPKPRAAKPKASKAPRPGARDLVPHKDLPPETVELIERVGDERTRGPRASDDGFAFWTATSKDGKTRVTVTEGTMKDPYRGTSKRARALPGEESAHPIGNLSGEEVGPSAQGSAPVAANQEQDKAVEAFLRHAADEAEKVGATIEVRTTLVTEPRMVGGEEIQVQVYKRREAFLRMAGSDEHTVLAEYETAADAITRGVSEKAPPPRFGNPGLDASERIRWSSMSDEELAEAVRQYQKRGIDLGSEQNEAIRKVLEEEKRRRGAGANWSLP